MTERSRLVQMTARNIGCIGPEGLSIALDDIICLVGANNSGKTTVLHAYEMAVGLMEMKPEEFNTRSSGQAASIELLVHIPAGAGNVDERWKEKKDGLLLVRSKWEWSPNGEKTSKPTRSTWDPIASAYAEDGKASGLDSVFNSRLPKPFRIGSLQDPEEEHGKLLTLVLEPVVNRLKLLMQDQESDLRKKLIDLQVEAEKPVDEFRARLNEVEAKVNTSYRRVFSSAQIKLSVSLGSVQFDPLKSLTAASRVEVAEGDGKVKWNQQGTGSQRALFWSMLQVRSELNRLAEEKRQQEKNLQQKTKEATELKKKLAGLKQEAAKEKTQADLSRIESEIVALSIPNGSANTEAFLPGYMLLIDEPETALHPSAVRAAKEHLYSLAADEGWQVMLSTHHPAFVDPLKDHTTIVRLLRNGPETVPSVYRSDSICFSTDEQENLKSLLTFDHTVAEIFFGSRVVIVEGDTEFAAFTEVMNSDMAAYPLDTRPLIVRARGKATVPTLIKMLTHFKMGFAVLHDIDAPKSRNGNRNPAYSMNQTITEEVNKARKAGLTVLHRCSCPNFEGHLGMELPDKDKPYEAWRTLRENETMRESARAILDGLIDVNGGSSDDKSDGKNFGVILRDWITRKSVLDPAYSLD